jgi:histidine decarboxylase
MITLDEFKHNLAQLSEHHAGYPFNLEYDYSLLLPFLQYSLINLGDPYTASNYRVDSKAYERACLQ